MIMSELELLAPARNMDIGIAAIDCGADAVYIAGPKFGARKDAGNSIEDIASLCKYAHKFGARIFVTVNTIIYDTEMEDARKCLKQIQEAGADAVIVQDLSVLELVKGIDGFKLPLHASTQCAIRTPEQAAWMEAMGFSRLILERELSLEQIKSIRSATKCELEFFVHGALCVCYSGQCYLSQKISGRSANRGACIQACRSRYDLVDDNGNVLVKDKALLSLKDFNLKRRMKELAEAGITSFKIEGRLKNESYVRNVVRDYSSEIDKIIASSPEKYNRASFGTVTGGFVPDLSKTFNRGYTELFIDGQRGRWASLDAAKSMGEEIGVISRLSRDKSQISVDTKGRDVRLTNGDGFCFIAKNGDVTGFRGDVCSGNSIRCKSIPGLFIGAKLFRNISANFEKEVDRSKCLREIPALISITFRGNSLSGFTAAAQARTQDGRTASEEFDCGQTPADNKERMTAVLSTQLSKSAGHYRFSIERISEADGILPFMNAASINGIRRRLTEKLDSQECIAKPLKRNSCPSETPEYPQGKADYRQNISNKIAERIYRNAGASVKGLAYELEPEKDAELMRTKYCIRYELGICLKKAKDTRKLYLVNNGRRFALSFDCRNCEMIVKE